MAASIASFVKAYNAFPRRLRARPQTHAARASKRQPVPLDLLQHLSPERPISLVDLLAISGMSFSEFSNALEILQETQLIKVSSVSGREVAELTSTGIKLAESVSE